MWLGQTVFHSYMYLLFKICFRVKWALRGVAGGGGSWDLQVLLDYQPSTCGKTLWRNGLLFRLAHIYHTYEDNSNNMPFGIVIPPFQCQINVWES